MSSFRDQFSKDEKKSSVLDYDNSAAKYFMDTVGSMALFAWSIYILVQLCSLRGSKEPEPEKPSSGRVKPKPKPKASVFWIIVQVSIFHKDCFCIYSLVLSSRNAE